MKRSEFLRREIERLGLGGQRMMYGFSRAYEADQLAIAAERAGVTWDLEEEWKEPLHEFQQRAMSARAGLPPTAREFPAPDQQPREHVTDGSPCWCGPETITALGVLEAEAARRIREIVREELRSEQSARVAQDQRIDRLKARVRHLEERNPF